MTTIRIKFTTTECQLGVLEPDRPFSMPSDCVGKDNFAAEALICDLPVSTQQWNAEVGFAPGAPSHHPVAVLWISFSYTIGQWWKLQEGAIGGVLRSLGVHPRKGI